MHLDARRANDCVPLYAVHTFQCHTALGDSTVKRTISDFLKEGILVETGRRWQRCLATVAEERQERTALAADHQARLAGWVRDRSPMCKHITAPQVAALVAARLVTQGQLRAAGMAE